MPSSSINSLGYEIEQKPVTLPAFRFKENTEAVKRELADHRAQIRTIKQGQEAWQSLKSSNSFEAWKKIGAALAVGKAYTLRTTGSNSAWGSVYSREFGKWMKKNGFGSMHKSDRSVAIELFENLAAIETLRNTLSEKKRRRLNSAQACVKRWRLSTAGKQREHDLSKAAMTAWRRFVTCVEGLPQREATALWTMAHTESAARCNA
jgi:hypothetical protein